MESPEPTEVLEADSSDTPGQLDRLGRLEVRVRMLEERIPNTRLLHRRFLLRAFAVLGHYLVAAVIIYAVGLATFSLIGVLGFGVGPFTGMFGEDAVPKGPRLKSVASLPVDPSGEGTIQGSPTGEATIEEDEGSFVLVLDPAPTGLPARTTLNVAFDHSTRVYRDGEAIGDPVEAMNADDGLTDADPSAAGTVVVGFRIKDEQVFAERLDLSDEY